MILQSSTCQDCGNPIDQLDTATTADGQTWERAWFDSIGRGCAGRGEWGDVLPHRPRYVTNESGTARYYFEEGRRL